MSLRSLRDQQIGVFSLLAYPMGNSTFCFALPDLSLKFSNARVTQVQPNTVRLHKIPDMSDLQAFHNRFGDSAYAQR